MSKHYTFALTLALSVVIASAAVAQAILVDRGDAALPTIGSTIADFKLSDASGTEHSLSSLKGKNGTVLIFIATRCPVSNGYNERMEKLAQDYKARGVNVVGINSNATESSDDIKAHAAENKLTFTILKDKGNKIADRLGAERTPEVYLLDASNKLVYHGRIDNHKKPELVTANDLRDAIEAVLAGKPVAKTEAAAFGCSIKRAS
ncbi:MAG TPA: thioredoxin family protein [Pyrinomonadaceae bacterium]|jgi:peroxiredoxin